MTDIFKPIQAGRMRQRVTIEVPGLSEDGIGGGVREWSQLATVWASIRSVSPMAFANIKQFEEEQLRYRQHFNVMLRYGPTITTDMRLIYKNRILWIWSIVNMDVLNWQVNLWCWEGPSIVPLS